MESPQNCCNLLVLLLARYRCFFSRMYPERKERFSHKQLVLVEVPISIGTDFFTAKDTSFPANNPANNPFHLPVHRLFRKPDRYSSSVEWILSQCHRSSPAKRLEGTIFYAPYWECSCIKRASKKGNTTRRKSPGVQFYLHVASPTRGMQAQLCREAWTAIG